MSDKAIVPIQYNKSLITKDHPSFTISLNPNEQSQLDYYKGEVERLTKDIENLKQSVNKILEKADYIKNLETFRRMFLIDYCMVGFGVNKTIRRITILQCTSNIKKGHCRMVSECKPRRKILNSILNLNV